MEAGFESWGRHGVRDGGESGSTPDLSHCFWGCALCYGEGGAAKAGDGVEVVKWFTMGWGRFLRREVGGSEFRH